MYIFIAIFRAIKKGKAISGLPSVILPSYHKQVGRKSLLRTQLGIRVKDGNSLNKGLRKLEYFKVFNDSTAKFANN